MSLVVEDGSAKPDAESLASVAFADDYFDKRGNTAWLDLDDSAKEAALRLATDHIEAFFGDRFRGNKTTEAQALSWPRYGVAKSNGNGSDFIAVSHTPNVYAAALPYTGDSVLVSLYPADSIPTSVLKATAELAWRATQGELSSDTERTVESERVGEIQVTYAKYGPTKKQYPLVNRLLAPLLQSVGGAVTRLERA
jgi:hypothetical protein